MTKNKLQSSALRLLTSAILCLIAFIPGIDAQQIVRQVDVAKDACGPCAIINVLANADPSNKLDLSKVHGEDHAAKAKMVIVAFGELDSVCYEDRTRFDKKTGGMSPEDLEQTFKDVLHLIDADLPHTGLYLNRRESEQLGGHLRRIHAMFRGSLDKGMPVITSFRSFVARKAKDNDRFKWSGIGNHYIVVTEVQKELRENEKGFSIEYLDSATGKKEYAYIYFDRTRNFTAARGNSQQFEWLRNRPFLCVTSPSLNLNTGRAEFFQRTFIMASFAIFPTATVSQSDNSLYETEVEIACGQCQFQLEGTGCTLAIRHGERTAYIVGSDIDAHGDAHAENGLCNCIRKGLVSGEFKDDGKFHCRSLHLKPQKTKTNK